jgi:hypothetical protein
MKNTVSTAARAQTGNVYFFKHAERWFNSPGHLRNPMFYHIFMLLFGFVTSNSLNYYQVF